MGSIVMDGVVVEDEVIIGAGSLVPPGKTLESGYLYVGSPVKQARPLTDKAQLLQLYRRQLRQKLRTSTLPSAADPLTWRTAGRCPERLELQGVAAGSSRNMVACSPTWPWKRT